MTLGLLSGVIDPRERDRILCDAVVVPVTRDWTSTFDHQHFRVFRADRTEVHPDAWHHLAA
jgi:hypothetical protein